MRRRRTSRREPVAGVTLRLDPVTCQGIGMCAHVAPGLVGLDSWGYPVVPEGPLEGDEVATAAAAVAACPYRALALDGSAASRRVRLRF